MTDEENAPLGESLVEIDMEKMRTLGALLESLSQLMRHKTPQSEADIEEAMPTVVSSVLTQIGAATGNLTDVAPSGETAFVSRDGLMTILFMALHAVRAYHDRKKTILGEEPPDTLLVAASVIWDLGGCEEEGSRDEVRRKLAFIGNMEAQMAGEPVRSEQLPAVSATWIERKRIEGAVESLERLSNAPQAILVSGMLKNGAREMLRRLTAAAQRGADLAPADTTDHVLVSTEGLGQIMALISDGITEPNREKLAKARERVAEILRD